MTDTDDPPTDTAEAGGPFAPRLRILNKKSWRGSFRLEEVFWSILEDAAAANGKRLNEYIHDLLAEAEPDTNKSSFLRAHAAAWVRGRSHKAAAELRPALSNAVAACPMPCFVMSQDKRITLYNSPLFDFLKGPYADPSALSKTSPRISFQIPLPEVVEILRKGASKVVDCGVKAVVAGHTANGRARISLIEDDGAGEWRIMVFVTPVAA